MELSRVSTTWHKQVFSLNKHTHPNRCCQSAFYVNSLVALANMTHKIEWRQNAQNWFIHKFDGIWMDLLCVWRLNWIAMLALLIELIFDQFGTCYTLMASTSIHHLLHRLFHFLARLLTISQPLIAYSIWFRIFHAFCNTHTHFIMGGVKSLLHYSKIRFQPDSIDVKTQRREKKNVLNTKRKLAKDEQEKKPTNASIEKFFKLIFASYSV